MIELGTVDDLKLYLKNFTRRSKITDRDVAEIEHIFFFKGENVQNILDSIDNYKVFDEIQRLIDELIGKIGFRNSLFLKGTLQKMYLKINELQSEETPLHKGLILYMEGVLYYYTEKYELGIRLITLALIEDMIHMDIGVARKSNAFRFLATHVYDEITADKIINELNKRIKEIQEKATILYPEDVLNLQDHIDVIPSETNNLFKLNLIQYKKLFDDLTSVNDEDKDKKGRLLEITVKTLFSSLLGLQLLNDRFKTDSSELDLVYRILGYNNLFREMFGQYLIIECKNWNDPVGAHTIRSFVGELQSVNVTGGILVAKNGITGENREKKVNAELEITKAYHHHGITIIVLKEDDLKEITEGVNLINLLLKNYEKTRFDKN